VAKEEREEKKKGKSIVAKIKERMEHAEETAKRMRSLLRVREGKNKRIRFLSDFTEEDTIEVVMHSKYQVLWPTPCLTYFDEECPYCDNSEFKTEEHYAWTVRDLDDKENKVLSGKPTGASPIPVMLMRFEKFGTLLDRPYEMSTTGKRWSKTYDLLPEAPIEWKKQFEPFSKKKVLRILRESGGNMKDNGNSGGE
jgi:hypothetical protein